MPLVRIETLLTHKNQAVRNLTQKLLKLTLDNEALVEETYYSDKYPLVTFFCIKDPLFSYSIRFMRHALYLEIFDHNRYTRPKGFKGIGVKLNEGEKIIEALLGFTPVERK